MIKEGVKTGLGMGVGEGAGAAVVKSVTPTFSRIGVSVVRALHFGTLRSGLNMTLPP